MHLDVGCRLSNSRFKGSSVLVNTECIQSVREISLGSQDTCSERAHARAPNKLGFVFEKPCTPVSKVEVSDWTVVKSFHSAGRVSTYSNKR